MRSGDLDKIIDLLTPTRALDEYGGEEVTWVPLTVWAKRDDVGGRESIRGGQVAAEIESLFTIRDPGTAISAEMRVRHGGVEFDVAKIARTGRGRAEGFELLCRSRDASGSQDF